ncbi:hypothetical protein Hanom_Chr07g00589121 [Helianthus anomalus]
MMTQKHIFSEISHTPGQCEDLHFPHHNPETITYFNLIYKQIGDIKIHHMLQKTINSY